MSTLEYLQFTVPDVVKKKSQSFMHRDPLMKKLTERGKVKRQGGSQVRINRIKSSHSDHVEINESNFTIPLTKKTTVSSMTGDWGYWIKPIIFPKKDLNRMESKEQKKDYIDSITKACVSGFKNAMMQRLYVGDESSMTSFSTLHGSYTDGTSSGFQYGALQFVAPASQTNSYLNETRTVDTAKYEDNWYNQFLDHGGIGASFVTSASKVKKLADSFCDEDDEGISLGVAYLDDVVAIDDEIRTYGNSYGAVRYTPQDLKEGRAHDTSRVISDGVEYFGNRWMTAARMSDVNGVDVHLSEPVYLINADYAEFWVNADNDFKMDEITDHMKHGNQAAFVGFIELEAQFALTNLLVHGCLENT